MTPKSVRTHLDELRRGGYKVLLRKFRSLSKRILLSFALVAFGPLVLVVVLLRPIVLLRFGSMMSARIGHFIADVEAYLCVRDQEKPGSLTIDLIGCAEQTCNAQIALMWKRSIWVAPGGDFWKFMGEACFFWTHGGRHQIKLYACQKDYGRFSQTAAHLRFSDDERRRGRDLLENLGVPAGAPWICIHNRDAAYLDRKGAGRYAHHDYRNFSIESMRESIDEFARCGYYVLRMGSVVAETLDSVNPRVIDYAARPDRNDFADVFLLAECAAYFGSDSGIFAVPFVFRKPVFFVNFSSTLIDLFLDLKISHPIILKRLWHKEKQRFLSLREIFELGLADASETALFDQIGVEAVSNSAEDIRDLAIEVDERLKGQWRPSAEDEAIQNEFWEIFHRFSPRQRVEKFSARIGSAFLRKHADLLS